MVTKARLRSNWRQKQRTSYLVFHHPRRQTFAETAARLSRGAIRGRSARAGSRSASVFRPVIR
jgi:hypothetical protein